MDVDLIATYLAGPELLYSAVEDLTDDQLDQHPIEGQWSIREVICHLADFEPIYADRMKRVIVENEPRFGGADPSAFAARLGYRVRSVETEITLIRAVRRQMADILNSLPDDAFTRTGIHPRDGALSLAVLLSRITNHIPHHLQFLAAKRRALRCEI